MEMLGYMIAFSVGGGFGFLLAGLMFSARESRQLAARMRWKRR
jgi:hypothetical protein